MKITTKKKEARQKKKKEKYSETHCVQTDLLGHFLEADFKERVETRMEIRKTPQWLLLHLTTHAVILKLKIVFNLCLCSFFKRTRNRATETSTATIPKMRISHTLCFSSLSPLAWLTY